MEWLLFQRFTWRHWVRSWKSTGLLLLILALGVGVFLSIRLANRAAVTGFAWFTESITGESDLILRSPSGDALPVTVLRTVREKLGDLPVAVFPVLEATVAEAGAEEDPFHARPLQIVGADLVALRNAISLQGASSGSAASPVGIRENAFRLGRPDLVFVTEAYANRRGLSEGGFFDVFVNDRRQTLRVAGILRREALRAAAPENLLLMDLPGAQVLLGQSGKVSRVELRVPPGAEQERLRTTMLRLLAEGSPPWTVETPEDRRSTAAAMTGAFRLNLTILSTLALLVGTYLILQAMEAAVVRRRPEIAILRSLGVEAGSIRRAWLVESLLLGVVGSLLGIVLGVAAAQVAVGSVARTVNSLYFQTTTREASLDWGEAVLAMAFGVSASLVAGWLPARDAGETPPAQSLKQGTRSLGLRFLARWRLGLLFLIGAVGCSLLPPLETGEHAKVAVGGYVAALFALLGCGIAIGPLFRGAAVFLGRFRDRPAVIWAASQLRRPTGRHRLAAAGLVAAVGMAAGMAILVASFEATLTGWISQVLAADLYVAAPGSANASSTNTIPSSSWQAIAAAPGVEGVDLLRRYTTTFRGRPVRLSGAGPWPEHWVSPARVKPPAAPLPSPYSLDREPGAVPVAVNEPFARRFGLGRGERFPLETPQGEVTLAIESIYADYSDEWGTVLVDRRVTSAWFDDASVSSMGMYLAPGTEPDRVKQTLLERYPALVLRSNRHLREEALRVFHQTFAVTHALRAIGVGVAVAGLGLTLASLLLERRAEMVTLKSLGVSRQQVARASAMEGVSLALAGTAGGLALGVVLGLLLVYVVNRQSFGWTLEFRLPLASMALLALATVATSALVAGAVGQWSGKLRSEQVE